MFERLSLQIASDYGRVFEEWLQIVAVVLREIWNITVVKYYNNGKKIFSFVVTCK